MRCNACGKCVDKHEKMYNPTMLLGEKHFAIQRLNAPLICEGCKPLFEKKHKEMRRNGIGVFVIIALMIVGLLIFNWFKHN